MNRRLASVALTVLAAGALVTGLIIDFDGFYPWVIPTAATLVVGGVLTYRLPSNRVGWLLMLFGAGASVSALIQVLATGVDDEILAGWMDAIGYSFNTLAVVYSLGAVLLRFPGGELLSRRWRSAEFALLATAALGGSAALLNGGWGGDAAQAAAESPLRAATAPLGGVLSSGFYVLMSLSLSLAAVSVIVRYRRSRGDERLQMKWLTYAGGFLLIVLFGLLLASSITGEALLNVDGATALLVAVAMTGIPIAVAVAILKYRLYDIDVVISRTLVLAVLAGFITLVYALVVVGVGALFGGDSEGLVLPILATAIVAIAFEPVRNMAQGWANRLVYGRRATPYEVLSDLTGRLSHGEEGEGLLGRMAERMGDGTGAERTTIWLGSPGTMTPGASWPFESSAGRTIELADDNVFPVTHDGAIVGAFEVVKPRGSALSTAERSLIDDLAGSAGAVLGYQRLNDSLHEKAAELAQSRARLVDAQDQERRKLERDLHDGAQQLIVALKVKIGLAKAMAAKQDAEPLVELLGGLSDEAQDALEEVRALAKGIYPPVLESDGLASAVSALAAGAAVDVVVRCEGLGRFERDIETALYFEISEAVTNAVKHAAGPIQVDLVGTADVVSFSVSDSGPGFDVGEANGGSGLQNLRDRIDAVGGVVEIESSPGSGTVVRGEIPLAPVPV